MRQIGSIEDGNQAERFAAYLATLGISCSVDLGQTGNIVWVHEEDRVAQARDELAKFRAEPDHERYRNAVQRLKVVTSPQPAVTRAKTINLRDRWTSPTIEHCPLTFGLMALMVAVAVFKGLDPTKHQALYPRLLFSNDLTMDAIWAGEVWRLITPIFLHSTMLHLVFNLLCLRDFGLLVEFRIGTLKYLGIVLAIAALSNYAQFALAPRIPFGGMSGVVYGLFGFAWVRSRMDADSGIWISQRTVTVMIGWQIMCMTIIPDIANGAHIGGLIVGAALGAGGPLLKSLLRR